jgi:FKBP-type peptidyl-prolyl cis-trans isomerase
MKTYLVLSLLFSVSLVHVADAMKDTIKQSGKQTMKRETLPSGLQYEIISESKDANAKSPQKGKMVTVHYTGWLADEKGEPMMDKKFDSSVDRGKPFQFILGVGQVIRGWDEGVALMKVGEKRRLILPPALAYGARGAGPLIPPNATLVFDVELLDVK